MIPIRAIAALGLAAGLSSPQAAFALTLQEAIALAQRGNPSVSQSAAQVDAAEARLSQARSGRLPALTLSGEAGEGRTDLGGFFGFGRADISPRGAALELRQPLFSGGAVSASIDQARQGRDAALAQAGGLRSLLSARTAEAYVAVLSAREILALNEAQVVQTGKIVDQAQMRFAAGETALTDVAQSKAKLAEARAGLARAAGAVARAHAHFVTVVGVEPEGLESAPPLPSIPASLESALSSALQNSPALAAAQAQARAADAGARYAQAGRLPSLALVARSDSARDQFFPGYRADGATIAVQGRWILFAGGLTNGKIDEARAGARGAQTGVDIARAQVREAVIGAWQDLQTSRALVDAAADQLTAATSALESVRNEVRVGEKPVIDLLDAERDVLAAHSAGVAARGGLVTAAYQLDAALRGG